MNKLFTDITCIQTVNWNMTRKEKKFFRCEDEKLCRRKKLLYFPSTTLTRNFVGNTGNFYMNKFGKSWGGKQFPPRGLNLKINSNFGWASLSDESLKGCCGAKDETCHSQKNRLEVLRHKNCRITNELKIKFFCNILRAQTVNFNVTLLSGWFMH